MILAALLMALLSVAAVACDDDDDDDADSNGGGAATEDAGDGTGASDEQLCNDLDDLETAVQGLGDLDSDSTLDEVQSALTAVETAWQEVESAAGDVAQSEAAALGAAIENFGDTVQNLSGSDTVGDAQADVDAAADEIVEARIDLATGANCS
jgi:hypothetical protein